MAELENLPAFTQQLDENLRSDERLTQMKDMTISDVVRGNFDLGDKLKTSEGTREGMVTIPGEDSSDEDRNAYYTKLGRPESPDKYEFEVLEHPEGRVRDEVLENKIRKTAHEQGISASALKALHKAVSEHGIEQHNEVQKELKDQNEKDTNALKDIWKGDSFKENIEKSKRTFSAMIEKMDIPESFGGKQGMIDEFKVLGLLDDTNPKLAYFMAKSFELIGDDTFPESASKGGQAQELRKTESGIPVFSSYDGMNKTEGG